MFESWRRSQITRLLSLTARFNSIRDRANEKERDHRQYQRAMGQKDVEFEFGRMALKANNCWMACIDANEALIERSASPLLFWWQLRPLEKVAATYETTLAAADAGAEFGRQAFRERLGLSKENNA